LAREKPVEKVRRCLPLKETLTELVFDLDDDTGVGSLLKGRLTSSPDDLAREL
jgi:hypothetical protein